LTLLLDKNLANIDVLPMLFAELLCLLISGWIIVGTHRRLGRSQFGRAWHILFFILILAGMALGFRLTSIRHLVSPTSRVYGVPFHIAGGDFIDGRWIDGGVGRGMPLPLLANLACGVAIFLFPFAALVFFRAGKGQTVVA
jgi:hypothetical protein